MNDTLSKIHLVELEILDEFDRVCNKYKLSYFLDSGSALGAVRHQGFIPWDDDIDVGMLREDYEKFLKVAQNNLNSKFILQTHGNDPKYYKFNAKLRKRNTFFEEFGSINYAFRGIAIDIFPFDYIPDGYRKSINRIKKGRFFQRVLSFYTRDPKDMGMLKGILHRLILKFDYEKLREKYDKYCRKFETKKTNTITCFSYKMLLTKNLFFKIKDIIPVHDIEFENRKYSIMNNTDAYLRTMYGDYMKLPPVNKREYHLQGKVLFGDEEEL